jgi:predicted permease
MGELWRRIWYFLNRSRLERELREEMAAHRAMMTPASPRFGNELRLREESSDIWGWAWLDRLRQDVRFALRLLVRAPLFTLTAVAVLSLGVGVNLAAFQVLDAVAFSPLPVSEPDRLVKVEHRNPKGHTTSFSYPEFAFYRDRAQVFSSTFALAYASVTLGDDMSRHLDGEFVSANYFADLGARPVAGRLLDSGDERADAPPVLVLAEAVWRSRFGAEPALVGGTLRVNGRPFTVAGIVPDAFVGFRDRTRVWIPITQHRMAFEGSDLLSNWADHGAIRFYARLNSGLTLTSAEAALASLPPALRAMQPTIIPEGEWLDLLPAGRYLPIETSNVAGLALVGALVMLVLVAACMNLGLLVLSQALGRDREFSIRLSVGATRGRLVRQLLTEYLVLGAIGAAAGCVVSAWATRIFAVATDMPVGITPHFTLRTAFAAAALAILASVLFGFTPALQTARPSFSRHIRLRSILIGAQVAAASVLLIVSGLIVRGVTRVVRVPLGFEYRQAITIDPDLTSHGMKAAQAQAFWQGMEARVAQLPGVASAALTTLPPFGNRVTINRTGTVFYKVSPEYFETFRIPLRRGRLFKATERKVIVISEALARRNWGSQDPLGQTYYDAMVIGIVGDARTVRIGDTSTTEAYQPIEPEDLPFAVMVVRSNGAPADTARLLMAASRSLDSTLSPSTLLLSDALDKRIADPRQVATIAAVLGVCALLLAVVGLSGMVAFTVSQRLREIGIRVALGARPAHVVRAIARQFAWPVAGGALAGSAIAALVGTVMSRELFGISQLDPLAHGGALLLFALVAALSALPSARRAMRVDPVQTLRHE